MEYLLYIILLINILSLFQEEILNVAYVQFLKRPTPAEYTLHSDLVEMRRTLATISVTEQFAAHMKLTRKINATEAQLKDMTRTRTSTTANHKFMFRNALRLAFGLTTFALAIYYRYTPVYVFTNDAYVYAPFTWFVSFPTGVKGAVSTHAWIVATNVVLRRIKSGIQGAGHVVG